MNFTLLSTVIGGGASTASEVANVSTDVTSGFGIGSVSFWIIYVIVLAGIFYFLAVRPQKKQQKEIATLQAGLKIDDWVLLDSGIYGKIKDMSDHVFTIELGTSKSILVPVLRHKVISKGEPDYSKK